MLWVRAGWLELENVTEMRKSFGGVVTGERGVCGWKVICILEWGGCLIK